MQSKISSVNPPASILIGCLFFLAGCTQEADTAAQLLPQRQKTPYVIGMVLPLTGPGIAVSTPYLEGMQLRIDELNQQGGIQGRPVKITVQDGRLEGSESAKAAQYLLTVEKPDIGIALFGLPAIAVSPIFERAEKPFLYEAYIHSPLENPYAFKTGFDAVSGCDRLMRYAKEHQVYKSLGLFMARVEYNQLCAERVREIDPTVKEYWYEFGEKDFRSLLSRAHGDGVDALLTIGIDFEYVSLFSQLDALDYNMKVLCATATECIFDDVIASTSPQVLEGTLSIDFAPPHLDRTSFGKKFATVHPEPKQIDLAFGATGYDVATLVTEAMRSCAPGESECLVGALENLKDYPSVLSSSGFSGRVLQLPTTMYEYRNGQWNALDKSSDGSLLP